MDPVSEVWDLAACILLLHFSTPATTLLTEYSKKPRVIMSLLAPSQ